MNDFNAAYIRANSPDYPYEPGERPASPPANHLDQFRTEFGCWATGNGIEFISPDEDDRYATVDLPRLEEGIRTLITAARAELAAQIAAELEGIGARLGARDYIVARRSLAKLQDRLEEDASPPPPPVASAAAVSPPARSAGSHMPGNSEPVREKLVEEFFAFMSERDPVEELAPPPDDATGRLSLLLADLHAAGSLTMAVPGLLPGRERDTAALIDRYLRHGQP